MQLMYCTILPKFIFGDAWSICSLIFQTLLFITDLGFYLNSGSWHYVRKKNVILDFWTPTQLIILKTLYERLMKLGELKNSQPPILVYENFSFLSLEWVPCGHCITVTEELLFLHKCNFFPYTVKDRIKEIFGCLWFSNSYCSLKFLWNLYYSR